MSLPRVGLRAVALEAGALAAAAWALAVLRLGQPTRELTGVFIVAVAAVVLAVPAWAVVCGRARARVALPVAFVWFGALAVWLPNASLPFGDQIHYLLVTNALAHGHLDFTIDPRLFAQVMGFAPSPADVATHVAQTAVGPRPIQGYALPLLVLPGWLALGRTGVGLVLALVGAWTSWQVLLILKDLVDVGGALPPLRPPHAGAVRLSPRVVGWTWLIATATAPLTLLATHVYPNVVGAAIVATAYRFGFTAPVDGNGLGRRRPALAAAILALTLFLTPRDAVPAVVLGAVLLWREARGGAARGGAAQGGAAQGGAAQGRWVRVAAATAAVTLVAVVVNAVLYAVPLPYAGYLFGTEQAQELTRQSSITLAVWVTLPAILFDRTFGLAGTAAWTFVGLIGLVPGLRADRARLMPAALAVGASIVALAFFRLWEGGYAPPSRYFVDVLPLWAPFVAYGLVVARDAGKHGATVAPASFGAASPSAPFGAVLRAVVGLLVGVSAVTSLVLNAVPSLALNSAFDDKIRDAIGRALGIDPLAWLPSFQPTFETWWVVAYIALLPALAGTAALVLVGAAAPLFVGAAAPLLVGAAFDGSTQRHRSDATWHLLGAIRDRSGAIWHRSGAESDIPSHRGGGSDSGTTWQAGAESDVPSHTGAGSGSGTTWPGSTARASWRGSTAERQQTALLVFLLLNVLAIAWVLVAVLQPWVAVGSDPVPESLMRKWLPLSLAFAALGTAFVGRALSPDECAPLLRRHFLLYLVPLALMLLELFGGGSVVNGQLGAVYLLLAAGFVANALTALWSAIGRLNDRAGALRIGLIALVAMLVLLPYHRAVMPTASDEPHYLIVTLGLVNEHSLNVAPEYAGPGYNAFYPGRLPDVHGVRVGDAIYSIRDLGLPVLATLPYALAGRLGVLALLCLVGAALAAQLYLLLRDLRFAPRVALLGAAATALVHPLFTYTTQIYPELLTALVFVTAVRAIRHGERATLGELAVASALVGALPWLSTRAWPTVVGVGLVVAYCALRPVLRDRSRAGWPGDRARAGWPRDLALRAAAGALPFAALVLALCFVNWRTFGLFMPSAGYFLIREQQPVLTYTPWIGAPGLLFDRVFGLIPRAPVYLLAFVGAAALWRRAREHGVELAALAAGSLLSYVYIADIAYWWSDGSPPSRYMLGSLPLLVAAVAGGWEVVLARGARARALAGLTLAASGAVAYVYAVLPNIRYDLALDVRASGSSGALFAFLHRALGVDPGLAFPSLVVASGTDAALAAAWIAAAAGLAWLGARSLPVRSPTRGPR